jgi:hypothetical protein
MTILMVNGGGNTPQGHVADGTSSTLMLGEATGRSDAVPVVGDWNSDGRDSIGSDVGGTLGEDSWITAGEPLTFDNVVSLGGVLVASGDVDGTEKDLEVVGGSRPPGEGDYSGTHVLYQDVYLPAVQDTGTPDWLLV